MLPSEILTKAADLIEPEGAWTQGTSARNRDGAPVRADAEDATCWCAVGAIDRFAQGPNSIFSVAYRAMCERIDHILVSPWNDAPERTQAEVVEALRKAAELAKAEGQ